MKKISPAEAAEILGLAERQLRNHQRKGLKYHVNKHQRGSPKYFIESEVQEYADKIGATQSVAQAERRDLAKAESLERQAIQLRHDYMEREDVLTLVEKGKSNLKLCADNIEAEVTAAVTLSARASKTLKTVLDASAKALDSVEFPEPAIEVSKGENTPETEAPKTRIDSASADILEIKNRIASGELISRSDVMLKMQPCIKSASAVTTIALSLKRDMPELRHSEVDAIKKISAEQWNLACG